MRNWTLQVRSSWSKKHPGPACVRSAQIQLIIDVHIWTWIHNIRSELISKSKLMQRSSNLKCFVEFNFDAAGRSNWERNWMKLSQYCAACGNSTAVYQFEATWDMQLRSSLAGSEQLWEFQDGGIHVTMPVFAPQACLHIRWASSQVTSHLVQILYYLQVWIVSSPKQGVLILRWLCRVNFLVKVGVQSNLTPVLE